MSTNAMIAKKRRLRRHHRSTWLDIRYNGAWCFGKSKSPHLDFPPRGQKLIDFISLAERLMCLVFFHG